MWFALRPSLLASAIAALALSGCGKPHEATAEAARTLSDKAAEKLVESQIEKQLTRDGGSAQVDLSGGSSKVSGVDKDGKTYLMEMGGAKVTEQDLKLAMYPGAQFIAGKSNRIVNGPLQLVQAELSTADAPAKVAEWYRGQLKPRAEGNLMLDQAEGSGRTMLMFKDMKTDETFTLNISPAETGSRIEASYSLQTGTPQR